MLSNSFFGTDDDLSIINKILYDFHKDGPVSQSHLESLAYIKSFQPKIFKRYESKLMFYMGLFYKTGKPKNFIEAIYDSYANAIFEDTGRRFTPPQADAYKAIKAHTNFSFSAPTSAGKSFLFQEIIKETKADAVIVIPSRALLSEYLIKIQNIVANNTLVLPFIEIVNTKNTKNRIYIITPERGDELFKNITRLNIQLILLDEAQLSEEGIRGLKFDSFVRRVEKKLPNVKKIFTHPFVINPDAQFVKHNITNNINAEAYNQKTVGKIYLEHRKHNFKFFSPFEDDIKGKQYDGNFVKDSIEKGATLLIYTSKSKIYDGSYLNEFEEYVDLCENVVDKNALSLIARVEEFLGTKNIDEKYSNLIFLMRRGIVIHHGSIPLKVRLIIEEFVNKKHAKICFSTSTLIQGINMPFDVVWINHFVFNGNEDQKTLSVKNLIGRAGRTSRKNSFDFGYVVVESKNKTLFTKRLNQESSLSESSQLDEISSASNEDYIDLVEAIKNDTFDNELHLTNSQIERISLSDVNNDIEFVLDSFFDKKLVMLTSHEYYSLSDYRRKKIKVAFERIFKAHLRRQALTNGERSVLSTAIPILLWQIQGKSFAEIVSLRFAFLSEKDFRRKLRKQLKANEISKDEYELQLQDKKVRFSCIAHQLPDKNFKNPVPLFSPTTSIQNIDFDKVIYDTYDYLDKVISLSIKDPLIGALMVYYREKVDERAQVLINYIKHGTNDPKEIWLLKYGFTFDEIERMSHLIDSVDETGIEFNKAIFQFIKDNPDITLISRYIN